MTKFSLFYAICAFLGCFIGTILGDSIYADSKNVSSKVEECPKAEECPKVEECPSTLVLSNMKKTLDSSDRFVKNYYMKNIALQSSLDKCLVDYNKLKDIVNE